MSNFQIPPQLIQMLKSGGNPQQMLMGMLKNNNNPMVNNIVSMMNQGNNAGIEQICRNICKSKGIDADELYQQIQKQFK